MPSSLSADPLHPDSSIAGSPLIEELTPREREILALFAEHKTDREIADQLVLSLNTVKWYARQIYGKLGVENRRMAVARAQEFTQPERITPPSLPQTDLPTHLTPFVGRSEEIEAIRHLLVEGPHRLITIVGPGGIGKTRLAAQIAQLLSESPESAFGDGIYFVPLVALREWQMIVYAVAHALGLSFQSGEGAPIQQLFDAVRARHMLLVLDNFEHLCGPESNQWILDLLGHAPHVKLLITSRNELNIYGEQIYPLGGLDMPDSSDFQAGTEQLAAHEQYAALRLFDQAARRLRPHFQLDRTNRDAVIRICRTVGGMPLAIELAANWIEILSIEEIAAEIERSLDFLETSAHGIPDRQRSLRAVCDHSWSLLTEPEQRAMRGFSIFPGGFDRTAAEAIVGATPSLLRSLVSKSWLRRGDHQRFEVHELLRQYCQERLAQERAEEAALRERYSAHYCRWLSSYESALKGADQRNAIDAITVEFANVLNACYWAAQQNYAGSLAQAINALGLFLHLTFDMQNGLRTFTQLLELLPQPDGRANDAAFSTDYYLALGRLLTQLSTLTGELGDGAAMTRYRNQALAHFDSPVLAGVDTRPERARLVCNAAYEHYVLKPELAVELFGKSYELYQAIDDYEGMASVKLGMGRAYRMARLIDQAREAFSESLALYKRIGHVVGQSDALVALGTIARVQMRLEDAERYVTQSLELVKDTKRYQRGYALGLLGLIQSLRGALTEAERSARTAIELYRAENHWMMIINMMRLSDILLNQGRYEEALAEMDAIVPLVANSRIDIGLREMASIRHPAQHGSVALAEGRYHEAHRALEQALAVWVPVAHLLYDRAGILAILALALRGLGRREEAWAYVAEALQVALQYKAYNGLFLAIAAGALLELDRGEIERSLELYSAIAGQTPVAHSVWFADIAGNEIARAASQLSAEVAAKAHQRGEKADIWEMGHALADSIAAE